jgi:hypothetical protein
LNEWAIKRCFKPEDFLNIAKMEQHSFADASMIGYGQCTYLHIVDADGRVHCSLAMGKSRVAPFKASSIHIKTGTFFGSLLPLLTAEWPYFLCIAAVSTPYKFHIG